MKKRHTFAEILDKVRQIYKETRPGVHCPSIDMLMAYTANEITHDKKNLVSKHLDSCELCQTVVMRLETEQYIWYQALEYDPEMALAQVLGHKGLGTVLSLIKNGRDSHPNFISQIKENLVAWASPIWQPMFAGEVVTATQVEEQSTTFEMDYGEYINLNCRWLDEKDGQARIDLSWRANLLEPSRLWIRFIDPDSSTILSEILLGTELEGTKSLKMDELAFNPAADRWAVTIIVEEAA